MLEIAVTITRIGTNQKYQDGWAAAFSKKGSGAKAASPQTAVAGKKAAKKTASPKKAAKKAKK
jgi:hypothetical protein